jgi:nucleotide-binding universal stress UspA family protein
MLPIKKILHPTDFSTGAATAFDHALHLARHHEAELHLLHVIPTLGEDPIRDAYDEAAEDDAFAEHLRKQAEAHMHALAEDQPYRDVSLRRVLTRGAAAGPRILEYADAEDIDLIVMGTHGRRGVKHLLLGSVAEEVVHRASCPVLCVRHEEGPAYEARPIQRILVPLDFSNYAAPLLEAAKEMAGRYGAQLHLLHVIIPLSFPFSVTASLSIHDLVPHIIEQTQARLEALLQDTAGPDVSARVHVREGQPAPTIVEVAREQRADLIMIAPLGLSGLERFFLGSVAERVLRTASCPVLLARKDVLQKRDTTSESGTAHA